jgi:hypothetical protein
VRRLATNIAKLPELLAPPLRPPFYFLGASSTLPDFEAALGLMHQHPQSGHRLRALGCPLSANSGQSALQQKECRYSITSVASAINDGGIVRSSAFAVLRLMTNSNFVASMTGRLAGFSPLSMRAVYDPASR